MSIWDGISQFGEAFRGMGGLGNLQRYQQELAQQAENEQYQGLLSRYGVGPGMQGNVPSSFYLEAAQIPSIRQAMLTGQMSQGGAMNRQQQAQQFRETSFPILEQAKLDQQESQFKRNQARMGQGSGTLGAQFGSIPQGMQLVQGQNGQPRMSMIPGTAAFKTTQGNLQTGSSMLNAMETYARYISGDSKVKKGTATRARNQIIQGLAKMNEAGALQDADIQFYGEGLPKIGTLYESGMDKTTLAVVEQLQNQIRNNMADIYQQAPEMQQYTPALYNEIASLMEQRRQAQFFGR